ncbi:MAG: hypothetical protein VZT48_03480 [Bulleidia sp.]|nr:hypothetical protein [Bulleidia sp.]
MAVILIMTGLFLYLCEGTGSWLLKILAIEDDSCAAPIGFALILSLCQLIYLFPEHHPQGTMMAIAVISFLVLAMAGTATRYVHKEIRKHVLRKENLVILAAAVIYVLQCRMSEIPSSSLPSGFLRLPLKELVGEWQVFNGLSEFRYFGTGLSNAIALRLHLSPIGLNEMTAYGFGLLYVVLSVSMIIRIMKGFHLRNQWLAFALSAYLILYGNYLTWDVSMAGRLSTWSSFFMLVSLYIAYLYVRLETEQVKYLLIPAFFAGLSCHNGFALAGIAILSGLMLYHFSIRKAGCFFDFFAFLTPFVFYLAMQFATVLRWAMVIFWLWFLQRRRKKQARRWINRREEWLFNHWQWILAITPLLFMAASFILVFFTDFSVGYAWYFQDFNSLSGIRDYLLVHSDPLNIILSIFRWGGIILLFLHARTPEDDMLKVFMMGMLLVFINPLCTPALVAVNGTEVYRMYECTFNALTESVLFLYFYHLCEWNAAGQWILELTLCAASIAGALALF